MNQGQEPPVVLSIAGSDSGAGAGVQADLKTFAALHAYGTTAISAITAQNTLGVSAVFPIPQDILQAQIEAVLNDFSVQAIKIGMLPNVEAAKTIAHALKHTQAFVVWDPVLKASSGQSLATENGYLDYFTCLMPVVDLITPNLPEMARFLSCPLAENAKQMEEQALALQSLGAKHVLLKGGHLNAHQLTDVLVCEGKDAMLFEHVFAKLRNTHGTGCTLSSAIVAHMAHGQSLDLAVSLGIDYVQHALQAASGWHLGQGIGPLQHFWNGF